MSVLAVQEYEFHPVEVKYGLLELAEGLSFLHNGVRMLHGNLIPGNVIINRNGEWKLVGFNFCCFTQYASDAQVSYHANSVMNIDILSIDFRNHVPTLMYIVTAVNGYILHKVATIVYQQICMCHNVFLQLVCILYFFI